MPSLQHGFTDINGASLYYEMAGAGPALVMLHGHLVDHRQWDDQFAAFSATHTVVRYDGRGMGQSSFPAAPSVATSGAPTQAHLGPPPSGT